MNKNIISQITLIFLIFITAFQSSGWGLEEEIYSVLRNIIIATMIILFLVSFRNPLQYFRHIPLFRIHLLGLVFFTAILFILSIFIDDINMEPSRDMALALVVLIIGLNINLSEKQILKVVNLYILLYTLAAISVVLVFAHGFIINELYLPIPKNQLSPAYAVAFILSIYYINNKTGLRKGYYLLMGLLLFAALLTIRGRAALVAIMITMLILVFFYIRNLKYRTLVVVIVLLISPYLYQYIYDAFFLRFDTTDLNSISAGRADINTKAINNIVKYPLGGQLMNKISIENTIHNYVLINLVRYGLIISSILLLIYFSYVLMIAKAFYRNSYQYFEVGPLVLLILFVVSIFEYSYPYAPGSATFFPFFLMGQYLQHKFSQHK